MLKIVNLIVNESELKMLREVLDWAINARQESYLHQPEGSMAAMRRVRRKVRRALTPPARKSFSGRRISREEALQGLGDPKTWPGHKRKVLAEFRRKPKTNG